MKRLISRRRTLQSVGGLDRCGGACRAARRRTARAQTPSGSRARLPDLTGRLARYMARCARRGVAGASAAVAAKQRILDTLGAIVSGAHLKPGEVTIDYVRGLGGAPEACVATTDIVTSAVNAAFANGMFAHADETDDFHPFTKAHPGCSVVPAALAMAEREGSSGHGAAERCRARLRLGCRFLMALVPDAVRANDRSAEGYSSTFGAAAAAAALAGFDEMRMRYAISYAVQQVSGVWSWERDEEHIEKAFDFSGMGARNGVAGATMIQAGFTGVVDALDGDRNVLDALASDSAARGDGRGLGNAFLRRGDGDQDVPGRLPDPGAARCVPDATRASTASTRATCGAFCCACPRTARASSTIARCRTSTSSTSSRSRCSTARSA